MAREINVKVANNFAKMIETKAYEILSIWTKECRCRYDNSTYAIRQFVLTASHSWGTAYCNWDIRTRNELKEALREAGATNIKMTGCYNTIYCAFDMKVSKQKTLETTV